MPQLLPLYGDNEDERNNNNDNNMSVWVDCMESGLSDILSSLCRWAVRYYIDVETCFPHNICNIIGMILRNVFLYLLGAPQHIYPQS